MSMIVLANSHKYLVEPPVGPRRGVLNGREREILTLVPLVEESAFDTVRADFANPANTETMRLYHNEDNLKLTEKQLEGVVYTPYEGFTVRGDWPETPVVVEPGGPDSPPVYGRKLTIEMGQKQYGEV